MFSQQSSVLLDEICSVEGTPAGVGPRTSWIACVIIYCTNFLENNTKCFPWEKNRTSISSYASKAELKGDLRLSLLWFVKAEPPNPYIFQTNQASGPIATRTPDSNANSQSRSDGSEKSLPKGNERSLFIVQFDHWSASEDVGPVLCAISD